MISVGDRLKLDFEVKLGIDGVKTSRVFKDLIEGPTLVSVYMRNNTGSCDKQMISLAAAHEAIQGKGFAILGVSRDTVGSHLKYAAKHEIGFPLISDPEYGFAQATDSLVEKKLYGRSFVGPSRSAYAIDRAGNILAICEKVDPANHGEQLLALIEGL